MSASPVPEVTATRADSKKKSKKSKCMTEEDAAPASPQNADNDAATPGTKKRKREVIPEEIEIDVNAPEPLNKKALRKAKKTKQKPTGSEAASEATGGAAQPAEDAANTEEKPAKRSEYGVWIGNLPWSATKDTVRTFLTEHSDVTNDQITRVHMPAPKPAAAPARANFKPQNKGFAYVDFSTELAMYSAIALTETLMDGRRLLIKNAKSYEGRPKKEASAEGDGKAGGGKTGNPPNKRVFVGNLGFDTAKDDLQEHFSQCGEIAQLHMATFEDSGKCKGYAWITFEDLESAQNAVNGYIFKQDSDSGADSSADEDEQKAPEDKPKKANKGRKWFVNRLHGRDLRCEFAEDPTTRYQKRYGGKDKKEQAPAIEEVSQGTTKAPFNKKRKVDARTIRSGAAHTSAQRASQAIVAATGKKITFD